MNKSKQKQTSLTKDFKFPNVPINLKIGINKSKSKVKSDYEKCYKCGWKLPKNAKICYNCGVKCPSGSCEG